MTQSKSSTDRRQGWTVGRGLLVLLALVCAAGAAAAIYQLRPAGHQSAERMCDRLARAVQRRDANALTQLISADYHDGRGLNREQLVRETLIYLDAGGFKRLNLVSCAVAEAGKDLAKAVAKVRLNQLEDPPRGRQDSIRLDLALRHEGGGWKVTTAEDYEVPDEDLEQAAGE